MILPLILIVGLASGSVRSQESGENVASKQVISEIEAGDVPKVMKKYGGRERNHDLFHSKWLWDDSEYTELYSFGSERDGELWIKKFLVFASSKSCDIFTITNLFHIVEKYLAFGGNYQSYKKPTDVVEYINYPSPKNGDIRGIVLGVEVRVYRVSCNYHFFMNDDIKRWI